MRVLRFVATLTVALASLHVAGAAEAQQFGRNKVRHRTFDFRVLRTEHFEVYYYTEAADAVRLAARMAERWHARLSEVLAHDLQGIQPLILYAAPAHFQQTNVVDAAISEGVGGLTESLRRRIVMPFVGDLGETDHVLGHELVHAFQFDMIGARAWPLWFMEGMAEYLSIGSVDAHTAVWMRDAAVADRLPSIEDLNNPRFFPYRYGQALFAYIGQRYGDRAIPAIMRRLGAPASRAIDGSGQGGEAAEVEAVGDPIRAIELTLGVDRRTLSQQWHDSIRATMLPPVRGHAPMPGDSLIDPRNPFEMNVGPVLSPDGSRLALLTSRNRLSIDLAVADATTGEIQRTLIRTAGDPHLDSLQFIHSAGTWDPGGERVAIAAMRQGRPVLAIVNADTGQRERDLPLPDLDEAIQPAWSPDGRQIAFSGLRSGLSDLYLVSVEDGEIRRLTEDAFAERQPTWSPDGRSLAFVTDRFSAVMETVHFGAHELASIDVTTGQVSRLPGFAGAQNGSPQWTTHGLHFVANPDGVPDVYRLDPATGARTRLTRSITGVTGITASSPALSVARTVPRLAFTLHRGTYEIRQLQGDRLTAGEPAPSETTLVAARLAPAAELTSIDRLIANLTLGLPTDPLPESVPFRPRLALDFVGQEFNVSTGGTGPFLSGGIGFVFSDMLGNHVVEALVQSNSEFRDTAGRVGYMNRHRRWNWGAFVQRVPAVSGSVARGVTEIDGQRVLLEREIRDRQVGHQVEGVLEFPLTRTQRFELGTGMSHFTFNRRIRTSAFNQSGQLVAQDEEKFPLSDPLQLWRASTAFVTDTASFGATGPLLGHRSRFEVSPTVGELDYTALSLDARHYVMPVRPFTLAGRALHIGRYGGDADSSRMSPFFLGFPTFIRGYDVYSFRANDCDPGACIRLDDLEGSRLLVTNLEIRAPLVGMFKGRVDYGRLPVDVIAFFDAGVAWSGSGGGPSSGFGDRPWARSAGTGIRLNALGFAVFELSAVHAFDRPKDKWQFLLAMQPGF